MLTACEGILRPAELAQDGDGGLPRIAMRGIQRGGCVKGGERVGKVPKGLMTGAAQELR